MEGWESGLIHQFAKLAYLKCVPGVRIPLLPPTHVFIYMWEYKRIKQTGQTPDEVFEILSALGKEGWEIIQYEEHNVTFSRNKDASYLIILKRLVDVPNIN